MFDSFAALDTPLEWAKYVVGVLAIAGGIGIGYWLKEKIYEFISGVLLVSLLVLPASMIADESSSTWVSVIAGSALLGFLAMLFIYPIFAMRTVKKRVDVLEDIIDR